MDMIGKAKRPGYDELAAQVAELREQVRQLRTENARLRAEVAALRGDGEDQGGESAAEPAPAAPTPGKRQSPPRWAKANVVRVATRRPRKRRAAVPGRRRATPDRQRVHALDQCPQCAATLTRGRVVQRRQIISLPPVRAEVVEHVVLERHCRACGAVCRGAMPDLSAEVGAGRRVSWQITALVAVLRTKLRLPVAHVQWLLNQVWGLHLAVGEVSALCAEMARRGRPAYEALLAEARTSPVAHVDETSWRENGQHGFIWTLSTPTARVFQYRRSRAGQVARELVGDAYDGVVVSDFYTAYDQLDGRHQRCWAHFLREIHELQDKCPDDHRLRAWAKAVHGIDQRAVAATALVPTASVAERERLRVRFERALLALCRGQPATAPHANLCVRVERYHPEFFTFVADPAVPPTNNLAERALRPLVIARKISGGSRSRRGSQTRMILQSLVATGELRGLDPWTEFFTLLQAPPPTSEFAPV